MRQPKNTIGDRGIDFLVTTKATMAAQNGNRFNKAEIVMGCE